MMTKPIAIILGGYVNGLGLVRSLGQAGIPSIVVDYKDNIASRSKYVVDRVLCPHPTEQIEKFIRFMLDFGRKQQYKGVIFCTNDIWLIPVSKAKPELEKYYFYPMPNWDVINQCIDKAVLYSVANNCGVPHPYTISIESIDELDYYYDRIPFPCILKPSITVGFLERLGSPGRTLYIDSPSQLVYWRRRIADAGLQNTPLILQEFIPGGVENLYTLTSYSNKESVILAYSTGHKIRQNPPDAGTIISGRVVHEPELYSLGQKLIKAVGFYGISNIEFKRDIRNGEFKLIEINPRPGMWNYSVTATGINLPKMAYEEVQGIKHSYVGSNKRELIWLLSVQDFLSSVYSFNKKGFSNYRLSPKKWWHSLKGKKVDGIFMLKDPLPGIKYLSDSFRIAVRKVKGQ